MPAVVTLNEDPVEIGIMPFAQAKLPVPTAFNEIVVWVQLSTVEFDAFIILIVGKALTATVKVVGKAQSPTLGVKV